jgi:hypothetical protein
MANRKRQLGKSAKQTVFHNQPLFVVDWSIEMSYIIQSNTLMETWAEEGFGHIWAFL